MTSNKTNIPGVLIIDNFVSIDDRGGFVKTFSSVLYESMGISFFPKELYYSISKKDVIRGMHFQIPPQEHAKVVFVTEGAILDVVLDLRTSSPTFGKYYSIKLVKNKQSIYIPCGCAHGFKCLEDNSVVIYSQTSCHSKIHDNGVLWNSFDFDWDVITPILSERDKSFTPFNEFISPF